MADLIPGNPLGSTITSGELDSAVYGGQTALTNSTTGADGVAATISRSDHRHALPVTIPTPDASVMLSRPFKTWNTSMFSTELGGSGSVTNNTYDIVPTTGTTNPSFANAFMNNAANYGNGQFNTTKNFIVSIKAANGGVALASTSLLRLGLYASTAQPDALNTNGAYVMFNGTTWSFQTATGSAATNTEFTGVTTADGAHNIVIRRDGSTITCYYNGTLVATHTTNLPTATTAQFVGGIKTTTTTSYLLAIADMNIQIGT